MKTTTFAALTIAMTLSATLAEAQSIDTWRFEDENLHQAVVEIETDDGGFILVGAVAADPKHYTPLQVIKTDRQGAIEWELNFEFPGGEEDTEVLADAREVAGFVRAGTFSTGEGEDYDIFVTYPEVPGSPHCEPGECNETGPVEPGPRLDLEPVGPEIVERGDVLEFTGTIHTGGGELRVGDVSLNVALPGEIEVPVGFCPVVETSLDGINPAGSFEFSGEVRLSPAINPGTYRLIGRIAAWPDHIVIEDSFEFEVVN